MQNTLLHFLDLKHFFKTQATVAYTEKNSSINFNCNFISTIWGLFNNILIIFDETNVKECITVR